MSASNQSPKGLWRIIGAVLVILVLTALASCDFLLGESHPGARMPAPVDPSPMPIPEGGKSPQPGVSLSGPLKPVGFVNHGSTAATVMAWTYTPLGSNTSAPPSKASTVSFPPTAPGTWPNSSRFLSLPLGTYTWCYQWEIGDINHDGRIEYSHAIDNRPVLLDESDSDDTALAESVDLSAPPTSGSIPGTCGLDISPFVVGRQHCDTVSGSAIAMGHDTDYVVLRGPITVVTWYIHAAKEIGPGVPTELTSPVTVVIPAGQTHKFELVDGRGEHPGDWNIYIWLLSIDG